MTGTRRTLSPGELEQRLRRRERPSFQDRWVVAAWIDEDPMALRECEVIQYEKDDDGNDVVLVRFLDRRDLFEPETATYTPWQLLPSGASTRG